MSSAPVQPGPRSLSLPILTERLLLRPFTADDVDDMYSYQGLDEVARYLYRPARTRERCAEIIAARRTPDWDTDGASQTLAICRRDQPGVLGEVVVTLAGTQARQMEIGWVLHPNNERQGYATEAARALAVAAFDDLGAHRLYARLDVENSASVRLCERLGLRREAHLVENDLTIDGRWGSEYVYAGLAKDLRR
ncbi:MAG TPA: GNAT family N-acetyltransferase [Pseudonocardiaceae bacterium]|jgi:RimJ/RimL family protein N-acetyltransferase|nr:GNAT family N-acetyltransferase [Pseudonocardiaceae bacterium]